MKLNILKITQGSYAEFYCSSLIKDSFRRSILQVYGISHFNDAFWIISEIA